MKRAVFVLSVLLLLLGALAIAVHEWVPPRVEARLNPVTGGTAVAVSSYARDLHRQLQIVDLHADPLLWQRDLLQRSTQGHVDLPRLQAGNVALQVFGLVTQAPLGMNFQRNSDRFDKLLPLVIVQGWPLGSWTSFLQRALYQSRKLQAFAQASNDQLLLIRSRADLAELLQRRNNGEAVTGALLGLEGAHALEGEAASLTQLAEAGLRMLGLAHFIDNAVAGSAHGTDQYGLTPFGKHTVREAVQQGMVIDLAHASARAVDDTLALVDVPVVFSHGGVRATCDNPRNLSDGQIRGIAAGGGVIGIGLFAEVTCSQGLNGTVAAMRHVTDLVGVEHVGLGSDFNGAVGTPIDASDLAQLTQALLEAGFDAHEIKAIMGANSLRVLRAVLPAR